MDTPTLAVKIQPYPRCPQSISLEQIINSKCTSNSSNKVWCQWDLNKIFNSLKEYQINPGNKDLVVIKLDSTDPMRSFRIQTNALSQTLSSHSMKTCLGTITAGAITKLHKSKREWFIIEKPKISMNRWSKSDPKATRLTRRTSGKWAVGLTRINQGRNRLHTTSNLCQIWRQETAPLIPVEMNKLSKVASRSEHIERRQMGVNCAKSRRRRLTCLHQATMASLDSTKINRVAN
jgi:hypothetical protein